MRFPKLTVFILILSTSAVAAEVQMTTRDGRGFTLETVSERITTKTDEFVVCGDHVSHIKKIKLWMPEHGHGSTPVALGAVSENCVTATKVNFTMPGDWDVRVELTDGDFGAFAVSVDHD